MSVCRHRRLGRRNRGNRCGCSDVVTVGDAPVLDVVRSVPVTGHGDPATVAVAAVEARAARDRAESFDRSQAALGPRPRPEIERLAACAVALGRVTLNFHPDRMTASGLTVAGGLLADGRYRSQWMTRVSNGSRSAIEGGDRHRWEQLLFEGAYDSADPEVVERPVYGSLDLLRDPHGGSPRFGSSYGVLIETVLERTTFCVGDSHVGPRDVGTIAEPLSVFAGLAEQAAAGRLLDRSLGIDDLERTVAGTLHLDGPSRCLDGYIEAQVHGGVDLAHDVESIVVDPSFRGTTVERDLREAASRHGFPLEWHDGSELYASDTPDDFRGRAVRDLADRVANDGGVVDAATIGRAAETVASGPPLASGDDSNSDLQQLKYLWHAVLALGHDA